MHISEYNNVMQLAQIELETLQNSSVTNDLAMNLLIYVSWVFICDWGKYDYCSVWHDQTFTFTASAQYMLSLSYVDTTISNELADCTSLSISQYDLSDALNIGTYNNIDFMSNPTCNTTLNPENIGYNAVLSGADFSISVDVRSMMDSVALNFELVQLSTIGVVDASPSYEFYHNNYKYTGTFYQDVLYEGSHPMFCLKNNDTNADVIDSVQQLCLTWIENVTGIPFFLHYGAGGYEDYPNAPMPCDW